jgi:hypothetical protein
MRAEKVRKCCWASTVVGHSTATCAPGDGDAEGRAQGHLGLAEADVAADEAVHRDAAVEVGETSSMARA